LRKNSERKSMGREKGRGMKEKKEKTAKIENKEEKRRDMGAMDHGNKTDAEKEPKRGRLKSIFG
jgi:hypothetical protein